MIMIVDASVAAKWYLPEEDSDKALALLGMPLQLFAPSLIKLEVCAAITRRVRVQELNAFRGASGAHFLRHHGTDGTHVDHG